MSDAARHSGEQDVIARSADLLAQAAAGAFDYLDCGCSNGGSLELGRKVLGGTRGLGIDIDPVKVAETQKRGFEACVADLTALPLPKQRFSFVTMLHFLEHLPTPKLADACIQQAIHAARDYVFIRHPWFDADYPLLRLGLKAYWSDWSGHSNHYGALHFQRLLQRTKRARRWTIFGVGRIRSIRSPDLIDLAAPRNSQAADEATVAARPDTAIAFDAFRDIGCLIEVGKDVDSAAILGRVRDHEILLQSQAA